MSTTSVENTRNLAAYIEYHIDRNIIYFWAKCINLNLYIMRRSPQILTVIKMGIMRRFPQIYNLLMYL